MVTLIILTAVVICLLALLIAILYMGYHQHFVQK